MRLRRRLRRWLRPSQAGKPDLQQPFETFNNLTPRTNRLIIAKELVRPRRHFMTRASLLSLSLLLLPAATAFSQELDPPEKVNFQTCDGVKIYGKFYKSPKKAAPAVIMVHNIEENSSKDI